MARPQLKRGESTPVLFDIREPGGTWKAYSKMPSGYRPPKGSTWRARASLQTGESAKPRRLSAAGPTKAAAERALAQRLADVRAEDGHTAATADTVGARVDTYVADIEAGRVPHVRAQRSKETYANIAKNFLLPGGDTKIAGIRITELTPADLNREAVRLHRKGATSRLKHWRALLNASLQRAVDEGVLRHNPVRDMARLPTVRGQAPKVYKNGHTRGKNDVLTDEQVEHLLAVAYADKKATNVGVSDMLALCATTGLRVSEASSLRWEDVNLDAETITIQGKVIRVTGAGLRWENFPKSELSLRTIPVTPEVIDMLNRRAAALARVRLEGRATEAEKTYVFPGRTGGLPDTDARKKTVRRIFDRAGLHTATLHTLRRTVENRLLRAGVSPVDIERYMGHSQAVAHAAYWDRTSVPMGAVVGLRGYNQPTDTGVVRKINHN